MSYSFNESCEQIDPILNSLKNYMFDRFQLTGVSSRGSLVYSVYNRQWETETEKQDTGTEDKG